MRPSCQMIGQIVLADGIRWIGPVIKFIKSKVDLISSSDIYLIDDAHVFSQSSPKVSGTCFRWWGFPYISRIHTAYIGEDFSILGTWNVWWNHISTTILCLFFWLSLFLERQKAPASHPTTSRPCRSSVFQEKISGGNRWLKGKLCTWWIIPFMKCHGNPQLSTSIFWMLWLPIFFLGWKNLHIFMVLGKPRVKGRVSLGIIGSFNPFKLTTHLSDPPSGNIELDPTPSERRMQSWQIMFCCFQGFLILKTFTGIPVVTGIRGGVWTQNMSNRILFRKMNK